MCGLLKDGARDTHLGGCPAKYRERSISRFPSQGIEFKCRPGLRSSRYGD